jgi:hypothetical protein
MDSDIDDDDLFAVVLEKPAASELRQESTLRGTTASAMVPPDCTPHSRDNLDLQNQLMMS